MKITDASHADHLTPAQLAHVAQRFASRTGFFIETVDLPEDVAPLDCGLYGPVMGDPPILPGEAGLAIRGNRTWPSRLVRLPFRQTRKLTVIAGPAEEGNDTILYTAYGGPAAPREPGDPSLEGEALVEAEAFWATHALADPACGW